MFSDWRPQLSLLLAAVSAVAIPPPPPDVNTTSRGGDRGSQYDMALKWSENGFLATVSVGTPRQDLAVFVDWTWMSFIVLSNRCNHSWDTASCFPPQQALWNARTSSTLRNLSGKYADRTWRPNHFFFEYPLHVEIAADVVQVGDVARDTVFQMSDLTFNTEVLGRAFPFSGIFGLAPVFDGDGLDYSTPFAQQWKLGAWRKPVAGFVYCRDDASKATCGGHDGIQTLGGIRSDLIRNGDIWWYDVRKYVDVNSLDFIYNPPVYNYWAVELKSLKIGTEKQRIEPTSNASGRAAIFDHASYGRGAPLTPNAYMRLVNITQAKPAKPKTPPNNGAQGFFSVECGRIGGFPEIRYAFAGRDREWVITPQNYVSVLEDGSCVLNVRALAKGDQFIGNFGETFAIDKYITLDFENLRVGISDVKW